MTRFLDLACLTYRDDGLERWRAAEELLVEHPELPRLDVLVAAYNEELDIRARVENLLALDYPRDRVRVLVASDGSTDRTNQIVREYEDRGVVLLAAAQAGVEVAEYTPSEVKFAISGYGKASKSQMQEMVRIILNLAYAPQPDDAADALAIALCHAQTAPFKATVRRQGGD